MDDLISRQAAIDAIRKGYPDAINSDYKDGLRIATDRAIYHVEQLPLVTPEQQWIPCSERLPEHGGRYLISVLDGINRRTTVAPYLPRCKAWAMNGRMAYWKVIAWMPLPEPYKGDDK